jgi:LPXTG-motif cell wall-anchored protein
MHNPNVRRRRRRVPVKKAVGLLAASLVAAASAVAVAPAAYAADPFSQVELYGTTSTSRTVVEVFPADRTTAPAVTVPGSGTINQIGLSLDGDLMMLTDGTTVYTYTASTEQWQSVARSTGTVTVANTMGGVDPRTGYLFYGGQQSGNVFTFARYNPATNSIFPGAVQVTAPDAPGGNGDLVFDGQGNMFFVAGASGDTGVAQLYRVDAADLDAGVATATAIGSRIDVGGVNSIAFGSDGYLYLFGSSTFFQVNPILGTRVSQGALDVALTDLGSRALPRTVLLDSGLSERYDEDDDFSIVVGGGGISVGNTDSTEGGDSAVVGPIIVLPNDTYTIQQVPSESTNPANYVTTWTCVDVQTNTQIAAGTGSEGSFTYPGDVSGVSCTFVNEARAVTVAADDEQLDNPIGESVVVDVVANDGGEGLDPASVVIVDGAQLVTELVVDGEGTWTVDPASGAITFAPEDGFEGNPTPIEYQVSDDRGNTAQATVTVTYAPEATDDALRNNAQGATVTLPVLENDRGDLDAASVRIIGDGGPVTELVVEGEGTWTVDPATGDIAFAPAEGFSGNPTPITYQVTDRAGATAQALVTVTYVPEAAEDESRSNPQGVAVVVPVLDNDLGELDPTTVVIVDGGELVTELVVEGEGSWTVDPATGTITFTPEDGFSGNPTPITYQVTDVEGEVTEAPVTVTYAPAATPDESLRNTQGEPVVVPVLGNDLGELDPTTVVIVDGGELVTELVVEGEGVWSVDPETGAISFTPEDGFSGNPTPITYQVTDVEGETTQAAVTVTFAPLAVDDESRANEQGAVVTLDVVANDTGAGLDPTSVVIVDGDELVTELVVEGEGVWSVDPETGAISFAPEDGFSGNPTPIAYQVTDERGETAEASVTVTYVPGAVADESLRNPQGEPVVVPVLGNDLGELDPTTVVILDGEELVTELVVDGEGVWTVDPETGTITFTPEDGFSGNPTPITYQVTDVEGETTQALVTVTFAPAAVDDESIGNPLGEPVTVDVLGNDLGDVDPTSVRIVDGEGDLVTELVVPGEGVWTVDPETGAVTFTPEDGFTGTPTPITYQVTDVEGETTRAQVSVAFAPAEPIEPTPAPTDPAEPTPAPTDPAEPTPAPTDPAEPTPAPTDPAEPSPAPTEPTPAPAPAAPSPGAPDSEDLAATGGTITVVAALAALIAMAGGAVLLLARRREHSAR